MNRINHPISISRNRATCTSYKTTLCKYWVNKNCRDGKKCKFAHGKRDIRSDSTIIIEKTTKVVEDFLSSIEHSLPNYIPYNSPSEYYPTHEEHFTESSKLKDFLSTIKLNEKKSSRKPPGNKRWNSEKVEYNMSLNRDLELNDLKSRLNNALEYNDWLYDRVYNLQKKISDLTQRYQSRNIEFDEMKRYGKRPIKRMRT